MGGIGEHHLPHMQIIDLTNTVILMDMGHTLKGE
jgi:hypothetical protein